MREGGGGDGEEGERETLVCLVVLLKNISFHGYLVYCFTSRLNQDIIIIKPFLLLEIHNYFVLNT